MLVLLPNNSLSHRKFFFISKTNRSTQATWIYWTYIASAVVLMVTGIVTQCVVKKKYGGDSDIERPDIEVQGEVELNVGDGGLDIDVKADINVG